MTFQNENPLASCPINVYRSPCPVKRSRALRGRNPTRDNRADGASMTLLALAPSRSPGHFFLEHIERLSHASKIPGGLGAEPPAFYLNSLSSFWGPPQAPLVCCGLFWAIFPLVAACLEASNGLVRRSYSVALRYNRWTGHSDHDRTP